MLDNNDVVTIGAVLSGLETGYRLTSFLNSFNGIDQDID